MFLTGHLSLSQNLMPLALLLLLQDVLALQAAFLAVSVTSKVEPGSNPTFAEACGKQQLHTPKGKKNPDPAALGSPGELPPGNH